MLREAYADVVNRRLLEFVEVSAKRPTRLKKRYMAYASQLRRAGMTVAPAKLFAVSLIVLAAIAFFLSEAAGIGSTADSGR